MSRLLPILLCLVAGPPVLALELPSGSLSLADPDVVLTTLLGDNTQDHLGLGIAGGDLDGDGSLDLAVAAPGAGRVYVVFGVNKALSAGVSAISAVSDLTLTLPRDVGLTPYALLMTDVDGDGISDLLIGTPLYDPNPSTFDTGRIFVLYGGGGWASTLDLTTTPPPPDVLVITSDLARTRLGYALAGGVDVNRDGQADLLITSPGLSTETPTAGRVLLVFGQGSSRRRTGVVTVPELIGPSADGNGGVQLSGPAGTDFGLSASLTPPLNTSTLPGVFVGAPGTSAGCGAVYGFINDDWSVAYDTTNATWKLEALCPGGRPFALGTSIVGVASVDEAPGLDLFVAASESNTTGLLLSWLSPVTLTSGTLNASSATGVSGDPNDFAGFNTQVIDLDGTGPLSLDLLWGAPRANIGPGADKTKGGKVHLLYGGAGWLQPDGTGEVVDATFLGATGGEQAGMAVAALGDPYHTGSQALAIGAPLADTSGLDDRGRVYVVVPYDESDLDGDLVSVRGGDCDDGDASLFPGSPEVCNQRDDDCDGALDEGITPPTWYRDQDGDGAGDSSQIQVNCIQPSGYVAKGGDCAPTDPTRYPGATELVCDGIDQACDGAADEHPDLDKDGFDQCNPTDGGDGDGKEADCDDADPLLNPATWWYEDSDHDTFGDETQAYQGCNPPLNFVNLSGDCDEANVAINPAAVEVCNGDDDNCDGEVDEGVQLTVYDDLDADGWGDPSAEDEVCVAGEGQVGVAGDCDDQSAGTAPGATEVCDGIDNDCDGQVEDEQVDLDNDGFVTCAADPGEEDCDDHNPTIFPGADDVCDGEDNNCDDEVDEGGQVETWADTDGDGDGDAGQSQIVSCQEPPAGWVTNSSDCDDNDALVSSSAEEVPNGQDDNCNGEVDEGVAITSPTPPPGSPTDPEPTEGDVTDGEVTHTPSDLTPGEDTDHDGWSTEEGDCDPTRADIYPGAEERCDGVDNDCDGAVDEGFDQDGRGGADCTDYDGDGYSELGLDCDDTDALVYPGAEEVEDGKDNNCDGEVDEGGRLNDDDGDGYSEADGDCDDTLATINPGTAEIRGNSVDEDCDGEAYDADGDGYASDEGDCEDTVEGLFPGAVEQCGNNVDDNCNGAVDEACGDVMSFTGCSTTGILVANGKIDLSILLILYVIRPRKRVRVE